MKSNSQKQDNHYSSKINKLKLTLKTEKRVLLEIYRKKTETWKRLLAEQNKIHQKNTAIAKQIKELSFKLEQMKVMNHC